MEPKIKRKSKRPIISVLILAVPAGVLFFFYRMYHDDVKALKGFIAAYERFDKAASIDSGIARTDARGEAGEAATELQARASLRLSSLIKNDAELMDQAREVADLSRRELEGLGTEGYGLLHEKRIAAYAHFQELSGHRR